MENAPVRTIFHLSTATSWRGGEQQVLNLALQQKNMGLQPIVWAPRSSPLLSRAKEASLPCVGYAHPISLNLSLVLKLGRAMKREKPDILHLHDSHAHTLGLLASLYHSQCPPLIVHRRVPFPGATSGISNWKYNHPNIRRYIAISQKVALALSHKLRHKDHVRIVYSGIDPSKFQSAPSKVNIREKIGASPNDFVMAHIGALAPEKDFSTFLRAALRISQRINCRERLFFLIVGEGPDRQQLEEEARRSGLEHIIFTGFIESMVDVYNALNVLIFCPKEEGLGTTVIEAMMAGVPVVATRAGGVPELIHHEREGYLVNIGDADGLSQYAIQLLQNEGLRTQIVQNAQARSQFFSDKSMAQKTIEVYREVWPTHSSSSSAK